MTKTAEAANTPHSGELGRCVAEAIFLKGVDAASFEDPFSGEFAQAAVARFAELHAARPKVYEEVLRGARRSASSQSEHKYQGINEVVQNADDRRASWLRIGFHHDQDASWLLFAHDGDRVALSNVLPMALPFLTTKTAEAETIGRFGIGLKTLDRLGGRLEVHSAPYHFAVEENDLHLATAWPAVTGLYDPSAGHTLLCLRLADPDDCGRIAAWFEYFDPSSLLFLRRLRRVSLVYPTGEVASEHQLSSSTTKRHRSNSQSNSVNVFEAVRLRTATGDRRWTRYSWKVPVPTGYGPRHKETATDTSVSLALPDKSESGQLFAWLPTGQSGWLPFHVNADFEPTGDRESIQDTDWNHWLLDRLGDLAAAVIASRFEDQPRSAWRAVPLVPEHPQGYPAWVESALKCITARLHQNLAVQVELPVNGHRVPIGSLVWESPALEGLLGSADLQKLDPERVAVPVEVRDKSGDWRRVLAVVLGDKGVSVSAALKLFDWDEPQLGARQPSFFVGMAAAALDAKLGSSLSNYSCILTSGLIRVKPSSAAKELLVREQSGDGLAFHLGLAHAIHPEYLRSTGPSVKVREWLEKDRHLTLRPTPEKTLSALYAKALQERLELDVEALRQLRAELGELSERQREHHGRRIGALIWVDGFTYEDGIRARRKVRPAEAYQPKSIDKQNQQLSWAQAAGETPGLKWIDSRFADSLAASQRRPGSGPSPFFRLLGARTAPRLQSSPKTLERRGSYAYATGGTLPTFQREAIASLGEPVDGLTNDFMSPDLAAVCRSIAAAPVSVDRMLRARALLHAISRQWPEFRTRLSATTVQAYYSLRTTGRVPATWLADLASVEWMSSQAGAPASPCHLVLDTAETRLVYGDDDERFAAEADDSIDESFVRALGLEMSPSTTDIVDQLQRLRDDTHSGRPISVEMPGRLYRVLASRVHGQKGRRGDLSLKQLRAKFGIDPGRSGLVFTGGRWYSPNAVLLEPPIFKSRRPFVSDRPLLRPLWDALGIGPPSIAHCLEVLREIAVADPTPDDEAILLDTYRHLEGLIPGATRRERLELSHLPLWTAEGWRTTTPAYAVHRAPDLRAAIGADLPTWQHDAPLEHPNLVAARGVKVLERQQFEPIGLTKTSVLESDSLGELFTLAVSHLREILASRDPGAYERLGERLPTGWRALEAANVWLCPELRLRTSLGGSEVEIRAQGHIVESTPVEVFFAGEQYAESAAVGGSVIASLFSDVSAGLGVDFIWQHAWLLAKSGAKPKGIRLAERDDSPESNAVDKTPHRARPGGNPSRKPTTSGRTHSNSRTEPQPSPSAPEPRNLKDFSKAHVAGVGSSGQDGSTGGVHRRKRRSLQDNPQPTPRNAPGARTYANYTPDQREAAGVAALRTVLAMQGRSLSDMRHQHGVGADLRDDLGKYYELKVHGGEAPDEVTLEGSQLERALREGENFVLAVVGGVEQGEKTMIKLIENPAEMLNLRTSNKLSLFGVKTKKGTEFEVVTR